MKFEDTKFRVLFKNYGGIKRISCSKDFILAFSLSTMLVILIYYYKVSTNLVPNIFSTYATIASGMIVIIIASLAIIVSMSDNEFIAIIKKENYCDNILFTFWYT